MALANQFEGVGAAAIGHRDVEHRNVKSPGAELLHCLSPAGRFPRDFDVPLLGQKLSKADANDLVIVHNQDVSHAAPYKRTGRIA